MPRWESSGALASCFARDDWTEARTTSQAETTRHHKSLAWAGAADWDQMSEAVADATASPRAACIADRDRRPRAHAARGRRCTTSAARSFERVAWAGNSKMTLCRSGSSPAGRQGCREQGFPRAAVCRVGLGIGMCSARVCPALLCLLSSVPPSSRVPPCPPPPPLSSSFEPRSRSNRPRRRPPSLTISRSLSSSPARPRVRKSDLKLSTT